MPIARHSLPLLLMLALAGCASGSPPPATTAAPGAAPAAGQAARPADTIFIGTGGVTGVYYPAGGAVCRVVNAQRPQHGVSCSIDSTDGSIANIEGLRSGDLDMGIVQSDIQFEAYHGSGPFAGEGAFGELRAVLSLHAEPFTVVARDDAGIASFADLKGKRVNVGNPGSGQRATMEALMAAEGWTMADFAATTELPADAQAQPLASGQAQAIVFTVGHPSGAINEATKVAAVHLVPVTGPAVDQLLADRPYYAKAVIPGGLYRGIASDTQTFGVRATLVTTASMPDDAVYAVVKSVMQNLDHVRTLHPALGHLSYDEMAASALSAPLHPGAERYFREVGLM
jgi:TRAP transporter TAXI family solute receptor